MFSVGIPVDDPLKVIPPSVDLITLELVVPANNVPFRLRIHLTIAELVGDDFKAQLLPFN
jgi:hypothetical protein